MWQVALFLILNFISLDEKQSIEAIIKILKQNPAFISLDPAPYFVNKRTGYGPVGFDSKFGAKEGKVYYTSWKVTWINYIYLKVLILYLF